MKPMFSEKQRLGINGFMKDFVGELTSSDAYDEVLELIMGIFDAMSEMCGVT